MTISAHKQFDFAKYIQKDLKDYNRLVVYFNNKLPQTNTVSETLINIILQVKTAFNITNSLDISSNTCYINIYDNYVKKIQKCAYINQNRICALRTLGQAKSNLFGWSEQEDGDALDKYMSQQNIEKYHHNIVDLHDTVCTGLVTQCNATASTQNLRFHRSVSCKMGLDFSVGGMSTISNVQLCKENISVITQCTNLCKDTYINELYIDYKLTLDAVTCFIIREYVATSRINIMLMCEFNEEKRILADKLEKLEKYINGVNYIVANIANV